MSIKILLNSYLTFFLLLCACWASAQENCQEIKATIEVFQAGQKGEKASVSIDFKAQHNSQFLTTLIGPKGYFKKDIQGNEVKELLKGIYTIVFVGKREEDNYCMKRLEFTIN